MSALTDPSEIRRLLDTYGFRFSKSLGQNFLIDASVPERIADSVGADRECSVLERRSFPHVRDRSSPWSLTEGCSRFFGRHSLLRKIRMFCLQTS